LIFLEYFMAVMSMRWSMSWYSFKIYFSFKNIHTNTKKLLNYPTTTHLFKVCLLQFLRYFFVSMIVDFHDNKWCSKWIIACVWILYTINWIILLLHWCELVSTNNPISVVQRGKAGIISTLKRYCYTLLLFFCCSKLLFQFWCLILLLLFAIRWLINDYRSIKKLWSM